MNRVTLLGHIGNFKELKTVGTEGKVINFSIATDESYKDKTGKKIEKTEWHNIVAWGSLAETISKYFTKGSEILVEGKLGTRSYEKDGVKHYSTEITISNFEFTGGSKRDGNAAASSNASATSNTAQNTAPVSVPAGAEDDLPF